MLYELGAHTQNNNTQEYTPEKHEDGSTPISSKANTLAANTPQRLFLQTHTPSAYHSVSATRLVNYLTRGNIYQTLDALKYIHSARVR